MPKDYDEAKVELVPTAVSEILEAPIIKGSEVGSVLVRYDGKDYITLPLVAADDVERSIIAYVFNHTKKFIKSPLGIGIMLAIAIAIVAYIIYAIGYNKRRRNRRRRRYY